MPQTLQNAVRLTRVHHCRTQTEHVTRRIGYPNAYHMSCISHDGHTQYAYYDTDKLVVTARCSEEHAVTRSGTVRLTRSS